MICVFLSSKDTTHTHTHTYTHTHTHTHTQHTIDQHLHCPRSRVELAVRPVDHAHLGTIATRADLVVAH